MLLRINSFGSEQRNTKKPTEGQVEGKFAPLQAAEVKGSLDIFSVEDWMRTFADVKGLKVEFIWVFPKIMVPPNHPF